MKEGTYTRGPLVAKGKTKEIYQTNEDPGLAIVVNLENITAHDDPAWTKAFPSKAKSATATTCRVFELLKGAGLPVAYERQLSETEFLVPFVEMIPLEVVARRLGVGSFLKRQPEFTRVGKPHRFHCLKTEFFLKTSGGKLVKGEKVVIDKLPMIKGKEGEKPMDDPFIINPEEDSWDLYDPKKPIRDGNLKVQAVPREVLNPATLPDMVYAHDSLSKEEFQKIPKGQIWNVKGVLHHIDEYNRKAFLIMERAWAVLGFILVDWKIEFGWTAAGQIVIADVIDNDSWRLRDREFKEISKQVFRDGGALNIVEANYAHVAEMVNQFRIPRQAIVRWRGSDKDELEKNLPKIPGVEIVDVVLSGHKNTAACLGKLEEILREYPDGGVIIAKVGMSNGLGPILASHCSWPIISVPASCEKFPDDVWSSLRLPSSNPMGTILSEKNAILFALNILGQTNPAAYAHVQYELEKLDTGY